MSLWQVMLVPLLVGLVVILFALAMAEASLLRVRRSAVVVAAQHGDRRAAILLNLLDDLPTVMNAVLFAVLLTQVTATAATATLARSWFGGTGITFATVAVSLTLFVYGEAIPKTLAVRSPFAVACRLATPTRWLVACLRPIVAILVRFADAQSPGSGVTTVAAVSEDELRHLAEEAAAAGRIDQTDAELIDRSFTFGDRTIGDILVALNDVTAVSTITRADDALQLAIATGHRRLPVYEGTIENIVGFVRLRDLANAATTTPGIGVASRLRGVLSAQRSDLAADVLRSMQVSGQHLAVVSDGEVTLGIVTVEDLVEELVGTIEDQSDPR